MHGTVCVGITESVGVCFFVPAAIHGDAAAFGEAAVLSFPCFDVVGGELCVGAFGGFVFDVDDCQRYDEVGYGDFIDAGAVI